MQKAVKTIVAVLALILMIFLISSAAAGCKKDIPKNFQLYVWEGYLPEAAAQMFEEQTGIKLNITYATDNAMMLALAKRRWKS